MQNPRFGKFGPARDFNKINAEFSLGTFGLAWDSKKIKANISLGTFGPA
jgi:hypothetical protein